MLIPLVRAVLAASILGSGHAPDRVRFLSNPEARVTDLVLVAHEDDWQLFMGDVLTDRRRLKDRTIFVYLTAGDDGRDSAYWRTRERAALASTRLETSLADTAGETCKFVAVATHSIWRCEGRGVASYFLRLPDGRRNGRGFATHQFESLWKLRRAPNASISAIDESSTYAGWRDLLLTISAIVADSSDAGVYIHANDPSVVINPHDHTDHRVAGLLADQLRRERHWMASYYVGYALATRADNLSSRRRQTKTSLLLLYDGEMTRVHREWSAFREHPKFYAQCLARTYHRTPRPKR